MTNEITLLDYDIDLEPGDSLNVQGTFGSEEPPSAYVSFPTLVLELTDGEVAQTEAYQALARENAELAADHEDIGRRFIELNDRYDALLSDLFAATMDYAGMVIERNRYRHEARQLRGLLDAEARINVLRRSMEPVTMHFHASDIHPDTLAMLTGGQPVAAPEGQQ